MSNLPPLLKPLGYVNLRSAQGLGPDDTAALAKTSGGYRTTPVYTEEALRAFAEEAVNQEREAIAAMFDDSPNAEMFRQDIAAAIRSRSEQA